MFSIAKGPAIESTKLVDTLSGIVKLASVSVVLPAESPTMSLRAVKV